MNKGQCKGGPLAAPQQLADGVGFRPSAPQGPERANGPAHTPGTLDG